MKKAKKKSIILLGSAATGAILMARAIMMVFGLKTEFPGAMLVILIIIVSAFYGWMVSMQDQIYR